MILDRILAIIAPVNCLHCAKEGRWLCVDCMQNQLHRVAPQCFKCQRPSAYYRTCRDCRQQSVLWSVLPASLYTGVIKQCIWQLKFGGAQAIAPTLAQALPSISIAQPIIVPVPTASSRRRQRSYDQAILLARAVASQRHLPYADVLRRSGHSEQLGATRQQRLAQLRSAYRCVDTRTIRGQHIVLVDDVMTTGATLESAAHVLLRAGASRVSAVVIAQA